MKIGLLWYVIKKTEKAHTNLFWGVILFAISIAITGYAPYLASYAFYAGIIALLLVFLAIVLILQGIVNRGKQNPS